MKPVGLDDPRTGRRPWAVVQLRQENLRAQSYNLVGFKNHLEVWRASSRILRMIPGLENAEFLRYGQIHRNTYINAPSLLSPTLQLKSSPGSLFRGTDFRRGRLHGSDRDRLPRWTECRRISCGRTAAAVSA